jgi:hypothetical protein
MTRGMSGSEMYRYCYDSVECLFFYDVTSWQETAFVFHADVKCKGRRQECSPGFCNGYTAALRNTVQYVGRASRSSSAANNNSQKMFCNKAYACFRTTFPYDRAAQSPQCVNWDSVGRFTDWTELCPYFHRASYRSGNALNLWSGDVRFESWPGHRLSWLFFARILRHSQQILR